MEFFIAQLPNFNLTAWCWIAALFAWSGFVRSGLGFGGVALTLPALLLIAPDATLWLPAIGFHLLFFSWLELRHRWTAVDWKYIGRSMRWLIIPKLIGVVGLISLPADWLALLIYIIVLFYAAQWISGRHIHSASPWQDRALLMFGGYVSGTALSSAPAIVAVYARHVAQQQLRATLFAVWMIVVTVKLISFVAFAVPLQWALALAVFPLTAVGHYLGLQLYRKLAHNERRMKRAIGGGLALISCIGLAQIMRTASPAF